MHHTRHLGGLLVALGVVACTATETAAPPAAAPQPTVRTFGSPPILDQRARTGTDSAAQSFTPRPTAKALKVTLRTLWKARVGATSASTTMAVEAGDLLVASDDAVHVLGAATGETRAVVRAPDGARVVGLAAPPNAIVLVTSGGHVVRGARAGAIAWNVDAGAPIVSAPAMVDASGDGVPDVVVGTNKAVVVLDGKSGQELWRAPARRDGPRTVVPEDADRGGEGLLFIGGPEGVHALRAKDAALAWQRPFHAPVDAPPLAIDLDADGLREVLAVSSSGEIAILDGKSGASLWQGTVETDAGRPTKVVASAVAVPGPRVGSVVVATAGDSKSEGLVVLGEHERRFWSNEGRVRATPVVCALDSSGGGDAIVGTEAGDLVAIDAVGGRTFVASLGAPIDAPLGVVDVNGDGVREIVVVTRSGEVTCFTTGVATAPLLDRYRGAPRPVNLGWTFVRGRNDSRALDPRLGR